MTKLETIQKKVIEANPDIEKRKYAIGNEDRGYFTSRYIAPVIRLADVLFAGSLGKFGGPWFFDRFVTQVVDVWNLREDDLTKQSPETIDFLFTLLP